MAGKVSINKWEENRCREREGKRSDGECLSGTDSLSSDTLTCRDNHYLSLSSSLFFSPHSLSHRHREQLPPPSCAQPKFSLDRN